MLPEYLYGAVDLHVHSSPDVDARRYDDIDLAREAARAGFGAILIKSHQNSTAERALLVSKIVPQIRVFGGLVLNETVGGLNPEAVRLALAMGAKQIWMPTRSAANHRAHHGQPGGIRALDDAGRLTPAAAAVLDALAGSGCILGTGHLSPAEGRALICAARERGLRRILVTHPEWPPTFYPVEEQAEIAAGGGVWFERCFVSTTHRCGFTPMETIAGAIDALGPATTVLSTDLGQPDTPPPALGMEIYAGRLRSLGFSRDQLRSMIVDGPEKLLGNE